MRSPNIETPALTWSTDDLRAILHKLSIDDRETFLNFVGGSEKELSNFMHDFFEVIQDELIEKINDMLDEEVFLTIKEANS